MMEERRVVITGLGAVTPLGVGVERVWRNLLKGQSGARPITRFDSHQFPCTIACQIPETGDDAYHMDDWVERKDQRRLDRFVIYALSAAQMAFDDAGWRPQSDEERIRTGTAISSGIGGLSTIEEGARDLSQKRQNVALFRAEIAYQYGVGASLHQGGLAWSQYRTSHRMRVKCACHWRCDALNRAGRC